MKHIITALIFAGSAFSATAQSYTGKDFKVLHTRMVGLWKMESNRGALYEQWQAAGDNKLTGRSFKVNNGDTVILERTTLYLDGDKIIYSPEVTNQNNAQPVPFKLISIDHLRYTFENKEHDFPQRILYSLASNIMQARIEGSKNGKEMSSNFSYERVK